jgi:putative phosphonate metabolism protein
MASALARISMRYAIYFTPRQDDPLTRLAASWLGRDPFTGATVQSPASAVLSPAEIAFHTASARRYGFHATLKAPFRLATGESEAGLERAMSAFVQTMEPVVIPRLVVKQMDGFFALIPGDENPGLQRLADNVVTGFDRFRAPLSEADMERRNPDALSPAEFRNLCQWGYPYVFDAFRFHMTLTGRVGAEESARIRAAIDEVFELVLVGPVAIDGLALFVERETGAPFTVLSHHALGDRRDRKTA